MNDGMIARRVKVEEDNPWFNAGTEVFVRDWARAVVRVVVRDATCARCSVHMLRLTRAQIACA